MSNPALKFVNSGELDLGSRDPQIFDLVPPSIENEPENTE
jgi:hypothetical protein